MEKMEFPIRINRYLLLRGYCSRREADRLIERGEVFINGRRAVLGDKVQETDKVELKKSTKKKLKKRVYYAYNKPLGVVSHNPQEGEKGIEDVSGIKETVSPLGRLDKSSHGLMILTNDGRIVDKLLNPKYEHEKEYIVKVDKPVKESFINRFEKGVIIEGYKTKPAYAERLGTHTVKILLTEGKKHQIRRMCAALGYQVTDLKRTRIANIKLTGIKSGEHRKIEGKELETFLKSLNVAA